MIDPIERERTAEDLIRELERFAKSARAPRPQIDDALAALRKALETTQTARHNYERAPGEHKWYVQWCTEEFKLQDAIVAAMPIFDELAAKENPTSITCFVHLMESAMELYKWRRGEAAFNTAYGLAPVAANQLRGTHLDPIWRDERVDAFITALVHKKALIHT